MHSLINALGKAPFLRRIHRRMVKPRTSPPYRIVVFPSFHEDIELADVVAKIQYFLPHHLLGKVTVLVDPEIGSDHKRMIPDYINSEATSQPDSVEYILTTERIRFFIRLLRADYFLVTEKKKLHRNFLAAFLKSKIFCVDRQEDVWEGWNWASLGHRLTSFEDLANPERAQTRFSNYVESLPKYEKAYVFGTGPSLDKAYEFDFSDGYRIVCNTIVKNHRLLDHIDPHFIVAADAVYHFANNKHAHQFRCDLEVALERTQSLFLTVDFFVYLLKYYHPRIFEQTIPIRTDLKGIFMDMKNQLAYTTMPNILNGLLLPLGSSLAQKIHLLGFDGRVPDDKQFWKNSGDSSYDALKPTIQAAHPGFFKGIDYEQYARSQSDSADEIMMIGERMGKVYYCLNQTSIPALAKRLHPNAVQAAGRLSNSLLS